MHTSQSNQYKPDIKYIFLGAAANIGLIVKYVLFAFHFFNVAYFNCHGDTAIIAYEVLLVNIP
jgi:hypothetical protein